MSVARELADLPSASPSTDANFDNGTFVIDVSTDRVGIGTTAPAKLLEISAISPTLRLNSTEGNVGNTDILGQIDWKSADAGRGGDPIAYIRAVSSTADGSTTEMTFGTQADANAAAERMRIDDSGNVSIGTTVPASKLDVRGTMQVGIDDIGYDVQFFGDATGAVMLWDTSEDSLYIRGATADHATTSAGRIVLQTNQAAVVDGDRIGQIDFQASNETGADALLVSASIWAEADATFSATINQTELVFATGASELAAEKMRITFDGKVGIGIATPASLLDVRGTMQVGVDNVGHDVVFYGATAGSNMTWNEDVDTLELTDSTPLKIGDSSDIEIMHDGTNSYIKNKTGALKIATETTGIAVSIGHTTSETTVNDNLTVTGNISVTGTGLFSTGKAIAMAMVFGG